MFFEKIELFFLRISQLALLIMMLLTTADAISRYIMHSSITGAYEVTEYYLMIILVFVSISYVQNVDGHIRIDVFFSRISKRFQAYLNTMFYVVAGTYFFFIGYQGLITTIEAFSNGLVMPGLIDFPVWLSYIWVPVGSFLIIIRFLLIIIHLLFFDITKNNNTVEVNKS